MRRTRIPGVDEVEREGERGQAYTLEGIIGAIVVVSALVVGLQAVDPAPWTDPDPVDVDELGLQAQDLLDAADDRDVLRTAVTCVDDDGHLEIDAFEPGESEFGTMADRMLGTSNYRVSVEYTDGSGLVTRDTVLDTGGIPGRISVTETRRLVLFENDPVHQRIDDECQPANPPVVLGDADDEFDEFYLDNEDEDAELFAIVTVRVVAW